LIHNGLPAGHSWQGTEKENDGKRKEFHSVIPKMCSMKKVMATAEQKMPIRNNTATMQARRKFIVQKLKNYRRQ
jgi:hypothetical protein